jgi:hypothetical protein
MELFIVLGLIAWVCYLAYKAGKDKGREEAERLNDRFQDPRRRIQRPPL